MYSVLVHPLLSKYLTSSVPREYNCRKAPRTLTECYAEYTTINIILTMT